MQVVLAHFTESPFTKTWPFSESPHRTVVWEESLAWPLPCATVWQPAGKAGFKRYWFVPLSSETMIHFLICAGRPNRWPAILVNS